MIIYSVEICIDNNISEQWAEWMIEKHIPDVMNTNLFLKFKFYKNLKSKNQNIYTVQYELDDIGKYLKYKNDFSSNLQKDHNNKFKNKFSAKRDLFIKITDFN